MDEDDMYAAGSDDFRGYVWKIPPLIALQELRNEIVARDWYTHEWPNTIGESIQAVCRQRAGCLTCASVCRRQVGE